jgi:hypothetical protein
MFVKVYEVGEDIETIWQEKYPEKERDPLHAPLPRSVGEGEHIREKCEDQVPDKSTEIDCISDNHTNDRKESCEETEDEIGREVHR